MSGFYSRKMYDECFQGQIKAASVGTGNYMLHPDQHSNEPCFASNNIVGQKDNWFNPFNIHDVGNMVNIESHLKRIDLADSNCVQGRTLAEMNTYGNHLKNKLKPHEKKQCNRQMESSYSRMDNSALDVKSMTTSRFDFPIEDPRGSVYYGMTSDQEGDNRFGTNTRLEARDMDPSTYQTKIQSKNGLNV